MTTIKRPNAHRRGRVYFHHGSWLCDFTLGGRRIRKRLEATTEKEAIDALDKVRAEERERGTRPDADRTRLGALLSRLEQQYEAEGLNPRAMRRFKAARANLEAILGPGATAREIPNRLTAYVVARNKQGAKAATIKLELGWVLSKAFKIAKLDRLEVPAIKVRNTRTGFFERDQLNRLIAGLPADLRPLVRFASITGWRRSECLTLRWQQVDFAAGVVRLEPGTTKSGEGRIFPFDVVPELRDVLEGQRAHTESLQRAATRVVPLVFHRRGKQIADFADAWVTACKAAGTPGRVFHDLRRSAALELRRRGLSESDIMELCGWKTRSMFQRYAIRDEAGLRERLARGYGTTTAPATSEPQSARSGD